MRTGVSAPHAPLSRSFPPLASLHPTWLWNSQPKVKSRSLTRPSPPGARARARVPSEMLTDPRKLRRVPDAQLPPGWRPQLKSRAGWGYVFILIEEKFKKCVFLKACLSFRGPRGRVSAVVHVCAPGMPAPPAARTRSLGHTQSADPPAPAPAAARRLRQARPAQGTRDTGQSGRSGDTRSPTPNTDHRSPRGVPSLLFRHRTTFSPKLPLPIAISRRQGDLHTPGEAAGSPPAQNRPAPGQGRPASFL